MGYERDAFRVALNGLKISLNLFSSVLPRESTYELQNGLNHILAGYRRQSRNSEIEKAVGHIRRAHLDYLKIQIFHINNVITADKIKYGVDKVSDFQKKLIAFRVDELCAVGTEHDQTIKNFRELIDQYKEILPESRNIPPKLPDDTVLRAATAQTTLLLTPEGEELLWEWAQLELMLTSLCGQRTYDIVYNMIHSYLCEDDFVKSLRGQNATIKFLLIESAFAMDHEGFFKASLLNMPEWIDHVAPASEKLRGGDDSSAEIIENSIEKPFIELLKFLGIELKELKLKS